MSIAGGIAAALRQEAPYQAEIQMGAQLILDFQGGRSGRRPYYWHRGVRYSDLRRVPNTSFARPSSGYQEDLAGRFVGFQANEPRVTDRGLRMEEARQNLIVRGSQYGVSPWSPNSTPNVTQNAALAPDGTMTAATLQTSASTAGYFQAITVASGGVHTWDFFVKLAAGSGLIALGSESTPTASLKFDLVTGAFSSIGAGLTSYAAKAQADGWWRIWGTYTAADNVDALFIYAGDATAKTVAVWLADLQPGGYPLSPIATGASALVRAADSLSIGGLGSLLGAAWTAVAWVDLPNIAATQAFFSVAAGASISDRMFVRRNAAGAVNIDLRIGGVDQAAVSVAGKGGARLVKVAARVRDTGFTLAVDGTIVGTTATSSLPARDTLYIGAAYDGSSQSNGDHQRQLLLGDVDDAQLARLVA